MDGSLPGPNNKHLEYEYTTKQTFHYFKDDITKNIINAPQILATLLIMKNKNLIFKINKILEVLENDQLLFTDYYAINNNQIPQFKLHRHDQSIFSLIAKFMDLQLLMAMKHICYEFNKELSLNYPFQAIRSKT